MKTLARRGLDGATLYLPIILMGTLALGTWWLVRNAPQPGAAAVAVAPKHEPDYFMSDFSVKNFDVNGRLQSEVQGSLARHFPDNDTLEIDGARMRSLAPNGRLTRATAKRALTNADGSEVQLFGDAVVTREAMTPARGRPLPRLEFRGEFLHAWPQIERVSSHQPVAISRGRDQFTADSMDYDNLAQVLQLRGRVRGVLMPGR